jgi:hypothetical protein
VTVFVAAPVLVANGVRNHGDLLGLGKYRALLATEYVGRPIAGPEGFASFVAELARSSFGVFRNADLALPSACYVGAAAFLVLGLVMGVAALRRSAPPASAGAEYRAVAWLASCLAVGVALVVWNGLAVDAQAQGRYLLPVLVPLWAAITCALGSGGRGALLAAWLGFLVVASGIALALVHAHPCV